MIDGYALVREWLLAQPDVVALCGDRIRPAIYPEEGTPSIAIGPWTATPRVRPTRSVGEFVELNVPLWIFSGTVDGGELPDTLTATQVMTAIAKAAEAHNDEHNRLTMSDGSELVAVRVTSAAPVADMDTQAARGTVTLTMVFLAG